MTPVSRESDGVGGRGQSTAPAHPGEAAPAGDDARRTVAIQFCGISKVFPGVRANDCVNLLVKQGEVHCLLGENGAGKSTLMNILAGIYQPDEGTHPRGRRRGLHQLSARRDRPRHRHGPPAQQPDPHLHRAREPDARPGRGCAAQREEGAGGSGEAVGDARRRGRSRHRGPAVVARAAAAGRDHQGAVAGLEGADPRRADVDAHAQGHRGPRARARAAQGRGARDHLHHPQAARGVRHRRPRLGPAPGSARGHHRPRDDAAPPPRTSCSAWSSNLMFPGEAESLANVAELRDLAELGGAGRKDDGRRAACWSSTTSRSPGKRGEIGIDEGLARPCTPARSSASPAWTATASGRWPRRSPASASVAGGDIKLDGASIRRLSIGARQRSRPALRDRRPSGRGHRRSPERGHEHGDASASAWRRSGSRAARAPSAIDANADELVREFNVMTPTIRTPTPARSRAATSRRWCWRASSSFDPKVVVFNKPTYGLDVKTTNAVRARIRDLVGQGRRRRARHLHRPRGAARAQRPHRGAVARPPHGGRPEQARRGAGDRRPDDRRGPR